MQIKDFCRLLLILALLTACRPSRNATGSPSPGQETMTPAGRSQPAAGELPNDGAGTAGGTVAGTRAGKQLAGGSGRASHARTDSFLVSLLGKYPQYFDRILSRRDSFRLQIIYTRIDRNADNTPVFTNYYFHVDPDEYF